MRLPEIEINPDFGTFPQILEWKPPCCSCVVFTYNGESRTYFDWHYKCELHKHLDGQDLIDRLHEDYENSLQETWKQLKTDSTLIGGGIYADPIIEKKILEKFGLKRRIKKLFHL